MIQVEIDEGTGVATAISGNHRLICQLQNSGFVNALDVATNNVVKLVLKDGKPIKTTVN